MKKLSFFAIILTAMAMNAQHVLYQEDFESYTVGDNVGEDTEIPPGFLSYDVDGDEFNWGLSHPDNFYQDMDLVYTSNFIMSASYITEGDAGNGNQGAVNANNILVLPMVSIPADPNGVALSYYVGGGTSHNFFSETYYVTVTTSSDQATILAATPIFSETLPTPEGRDLILSLDDFAGQDVYIAFRHQTSDQWMLGLDNLKIEKNTLSIKDNIFKGFEYFVDRNSVLNLKANNSLSSVQVFNVLGQKVISQKLSKLTERIDISSLTSGMYIVKASIDGQEKSFKIVKQ